MCIKTTSVNLGAFFKGTKTSLKIGEATNHDASVIMKHFNKNKPFGFELDMMSFKQHEHGIYSVRVIHKRHGLFLVMQKQGMGMSLFVRKTTDALFSNTQKHEENQQVAFTGAQA